MQKKIILLTLVILCTGCSTVTSNYQSDTSVVIQVESDKYEIVGDIEGQAELKAIVPPLPPFIPIILGNTRQYGKVTGWWGTSLKGLAYQMAMYNAIEDANKKYSGGVDALITPKSTVKLSGLPPLYWKWNVTVKGKGIRLITSDKK